MMSSDIQLQFSSLFGFQVVAAGRESICDRLMQLAEGSGPVHVLTLNPEILVNLHAMEAAAAEVRSADFCVADGVGIAWAARVLADREIPRYPGIDLALDVMQRLAARNGSVYLLGARPGVAERAAARLTQQMAGLKIAGFRDGYFGPDEEAAVVANILHAGPDLLLVGMGSPRQEGFIAANKHRMGVPLLIGVGGTFDVLSGDVRRAPGFVQRLGLEWVWRALQDVSRLRRLGSLPRFVWLLVKEKVRQVS